MNIDLFTATGQKKGTLTLPAAVFEAPINQGLMHQAVTLRQSNRRHPIAHAKNRSEVEGSTRKLYQQKHTGRARRGSIRSPLLRGGGKAFGPRKERNFRKDMPKSMRRAALLSCLSFRAKQGAIVGLESYPEMVKTKEFVSLMKKLALPIGRRTLVVVSEAHRGLHLSSRNVPGMKTLTVSYLNPEDVLAARSIVFLVDAVAKAEQMLARRQEGQKRKEGEEGQTASKRKNTRVSSPSAKNESA